MDGDAYKERLRAYYNQKAAVYASTYTGEGRYRSNYFRLKTVLYLLSVLHPRPGVLLEAGCGDARVVAATIAEGYRTHGIDFSDSMIAQGRELLCERGLDPDVITKGDIYEIPYPDQTFDMVLSVGVIENLPDHAAVFSQFHRVLKPGGRIIVSLNNDLFSLFSDNKHSLAYLSYLFQDIGLDANVRREVLEEMAKLYQVDQIDPVRRAFEDAQIDKSGTQLERYNPLNVAERLRAQGFEMEELRFFHYHPIPPRFETRYPEVFKVFAESLETVDYDWRGGFLCNCMLVQARLNA